MRPHTDQPATSPLLAPGVLLLLLRATTKPARADPLRTGWLRIEEPKAVRAAGGAR
jgi:hypothetical protein